MSLKNRFILNRYLNGIPKYRFTKFISKVLQINDLIYLYETHIQKYNASNDLKIFLRIVLDRRRR